MQKDRRDKRRKDSIPIPSLEQVEQERKKIKYRHQYFKVLSSTVSVLIVVAAVAVLIATLFFPVLQVSGTSMEPTLEDGDVIVLMKTKNYQTGELCGFYWQNKLLLKRVIGLPGNYIEIDDQGNVYVDGRELDEPYVTEKSLGECDIEFPYQVPDGKIFVMGDHRATSVDSRSTTIGCIEKEQIVGRILFKIWPLKEMTWIN